jgi:hypothetical protein
MVFKGKAEVEVGNKWVEIKDHHELALSGVANGAHEKPRISIPVAPRTNSITGAACGRNIWPKPIITRSPLTSLTTL